MKVLAVLESMLPSFCLSYKIQHNEAAVAVSTLLADSIDSAVVDHDGYPPETQTPFSEIPSFVVLLGDFLRSSLGAQAFSKAFFGAQISDCSQTPYLTFQELL